MPVCSRKNNIKINNLNINTRTFNNIMVKINRIIEELNNRKHKFFTYKLDLNIIYENLISIEEFDDIFFEITGYNRLKFYKNKILESESNKINIEKYDNFIRFYYKLLVCIYYNFNTLFNENNKNKIKLLKYIISLTDIFKFTKIIDTSINIPKSKFNFFKKHIKNNGKYIRNIIVPNPENITKNITINNTLNRSNQQYKEITEFNQQNDIGITINNTVIKSISGPVSFYYLRPIDKNESKYFPLIVLFGDYHRSKDFICTNCECDIKSKPCCYTISDKKFLVLLDNLVYSHKYPVDFYTETFFLGTNKGFKNGFMENLTTKNIMTCYYKNFKGNNKCPTKKIRWQAGDSRQSAFKIDLDGNKYKINANLIVRNILSKNRYINKISKKFINNLYIEGQICDLIEDIYLIIQIYLYKNNYINKNRISSESLIKEINTIDIKEKINEFNNNLYKSVFKDIDGFILFLSLIYNNEKKSFTNYHIFLKEFFEMMTKDNSLIYKQILKQDYLLFNNKDYWYNIYLNLIINNQRYNFFINSFEKTGFIESNIFESLRILINKNGHMNNKKYDNKILILSQFFKFLSELFTVSILDLYTLLRIFKKPKNGYRSSLSFCYFGNMHILNIIKLLTDTQLIGKYELIHSIDMKGIKPDRCLNIDFSLNLSEEVKNHNLQII